MSWLCWFRLCSWRHLFNVRDAENNFGVYQCRRCKTVSIGSSRDLIHPSK